MTPDTTESSIHAMRPIMTNHHLTVTDQHGNQSRGKIVYIQPLKERWRKQTAEVHIVTSV